MVAHGSTTFTSKDRESQLDANSLLHDPTKRKNIVDYHLKDQEAVMKEYIQRGACQPKKHKFPQTNFGENETTKAAGGDAFVVNGFNGWNRSVRFRKHVDGVNSAHNQAFQKFENLKNSKSSIEASLNQQTEQAKSDYRIRLTASLYCLRFLLLQGLAFRGHDECDESNNKGNFLELLNWFAQNNDDIRNVVLKNAPKNNQMVAPSIQKELINCCANETTKAIVKDLGKDFSRILVDESSDIFQKEQIALYVRYVDKRGMVVERVLGIVHVGDTTALSLKKTIYSLLNEHSLSVSRVRGQGYDGARNMKGELNSLKTLIMRETQSTYYVHYFAH